MKIATAILKYIKILCNIMTALGLIINILRVSV